MLSSLLHFVARTLCDSFSWKVDPSRIDVQLARFKRTLTTQRSDQYPLDFTSKGEPDWSSIDPAPAPLR